MLNNLLTYSMKQRRRLEREIRAEAEPIKQKKTTCYNCNIFILLN